jgi:hypothetical protein
MAGTYNNLTLSNTSGIETASGALTVNGTLTTTASGILNMGTNQLLGTLTTITNGGIIRTQNTTTTPIPTGKTWGGTIQYDAATGGQTVMTGTYNNLTISNTSGIQTANGNLAITGDLNIGSGGALDLTIYTANRSSAGGTLTIAGTLLLGGTTGGQTGSNFPSN